MDTMFTAQYFAQTIFRGDIRSAGLFDGTLSDTDLIRANNADEAVISTDGLSFFDGFTLFITNGLDLNDVERVFDDGEVLADVTFSDGTTLTNVDALTDRFSLFGASTNLYLLDLEALGSAGKTLDDVAEVRTAAFTEHDLNWSDFGFGADVPPPDTEPPSIIVGTEGRDRLTGTDGADFIVGLGGSRDLLTGGNGPDTFVFGGEAGNGRRERDVVTDFDVTEDEILITDGAAVQRIREKTGTLSSISLAGTATSSA